MSATQLATNINTQIKSHLEAYCNHRGLKMNKFIEQAILEKLEDELESKLLQQAINQATEFESLENLKKRLKKLNKLSSHALSTKA